MRQGIAGVVFLMKEPYHGFGIKPERFNLRPTVFDRDGGPRIIHQNSCHSLQRGTFVALNIEFDKRDRRRFRQCFLEQWHDFISSLRKR